METGSLLQQALQQQRPGVSHGQHEDPNRLLLDVFSLQDHPDHISQLLYLAELATRCNQCFASQSYLWHTGGDGPVFGVTVTDGIPHLRACCRYGVSVMDEWMAIDICWQFSKTVEDDIVFSFWDVEDGQVVLIQTANILPDLVDEDPTDHHRYACWLRRGGNIQVLRQSHVTVQKALELLKDNNMEWYYSIPTMNQTLDTFLQQIRRHAEQRHRMALVVPRRVAYWIRNRPDLVSTAMLAFCQNIHRPIRPNLLMDYDDWVWTTVTVPRTNYAMIRTMVSPEYWTTSEFVPTLLPVEVKRMQRQCNNEATTHLKHATILGIRLVVGLDYLMATESTSRAMISTLEQRVTDWSRIDRDCRVKDTTTGSANNNWLQQAFRLGPNHSSYNLEHILKCPVFPEEEAQSLTLRSHPETPLKEQILQAQNTFVVVATDEPDFVVPRPEDVDDESWMQLESSEGGTTDLDAVLANFQSFMTKPSNVEGVATEVVDDSTVVKPPFRPRVFLNILHAILKGEELVFPIRDPFFFQEDYDDMIDDIDDEEEEEVEAVVGMKGLMKAMDAELKDKTEFRNLDSDQGDSNNDGMADNEGVSEGFHVLTNLLQSLEASAGTPGPVPNMLKEMGADPPK